MLPVLMWLRAFATVLVTCVGLTLIVAVTWEVCSYIWLFITT